MKQKRIVVAMTGASGAVLGIRLLEALGNREVETHLVLSRWAEHTIAAETDRTAEQVRALAYRAYDADDLAAAPSSGSFPMDAMVICPCSMKTLAAIANGFSYNLVARAADVTLKEHRQLLLVPRETPLSAIHLENMLKLSRMGVTLLPPCVGYYTRPQSLAEAENHLLGKMLDALEVEHDLFPRWGG